MLQQDDNLPGTYTQFFEKIVEKKILTPGRFFVSMADTAPVILSGLVMLLELVMLLGLVAWKKLRPGYPVNFDPSLR